MLELFARAPDVLALAADSELTPIPFNDEASSLSAILLDEHYYQFLQEGKREVDGLQIVGPEHLIALKARAWLDLTARKAAGEHVDSKNIRKHKNDVFRLFAIVDPDFTGSVPDQVKSDLVSFLEQMQDETLDLKSLGLGSETLESVADALRRIYRLEI